MASTHQRPTFVLGTGLRVSPSFVVSARLKSGHRCSLHPSAQEDASLAEPTLELPAGVPAFAPHTPAPPLNPAQLCPSLENQGGVSPPPSPRTGWDLDSDG